MTNTITTRVFHLIHPTGYVFSLQDSISGTIEPYSIQCNPSVDISKQMPSLCSDCNLKAGIRNMVKAGDMIDKYNHVVEFYVALVNADNNVRTRPTIDKYNGKWVHPEAIEEGANSEVKTWIAKLKEIKSWTFSDVVKYKIGF